MNVLVILSYMLTRARFMSDPSNLANSKFGSFQELSKMEGQALTLLAVALPLKFYRRVSLDGFMVDLFFYCKSAMALLMWYMDYRWSILIVLSYLALAMLFPQPIYRGPTGAVEFTPQTFHDTVMAAEGRAGEAGDGSGDGSGGGSGKAAAKASSKQKASKSSSKSNPSKSTGESVPDDGRSITYIVELFAPWSPQCLVLEPIFAELSQTYGTDRRRFGKLDISRWPAMAKELKVDLNGVTDQLPTFVSFRNGKEVKRIPIVAESGKVYGGRIRRQDLVAVFDLE
jgi:thiol-disulfide isomerase/thioredoxin